MARKTSTLEITALPKWAQELFQQELDGISEDRDEIYYTIQCPLYSDVEIYIMHVNVNCQDWIIAVKNNENYPGWQSAKTFQL